MQSNICFVYMCNLFEVVFYFCFILEYIVVIDNMVFEILVVFGWDMSFMCGVMILSILEVMFQWFKYFVFMEFKCYVKIWRIDFKNRVFLISD